MATETQEQVNELNGRIDDLNTEMATKSPLVHDHTINQVIDLNTKLSDMDTSIASLEELANNKANKEHNHSDSDIIGLDEKFNIITDELKELNDQLPTKANKEHTHNIDDIEGLDDEFKEIEEELERYKTPEVKNPLKINDYEQDTFAIINKPDNVDDVELIIPSKSGTIATTERVTELINETLNGNTNYDRVLLTNYNITPPNINDLEEDEVVTDEKVINVSDLEFVDGYEADEEFYPEIEASLTPDFKETVTIYENDDGDGFLLSAYDLLEKTQSYSSTIYLRARYKGETSVSLYSDVVKITLNFTGEWEEDWENNDDDNEG